MQKNVEAHIFSCTPTFIIEPLRNKTEGTDLSRLVLFFGSLSIFGVGFS